MKFRNYNILKNDNQSNAKSKNEKINDLKKKFNK